MVDKRIVKATERKDNAVISYLEKIIKSSLSVKRKGSFARCISGKKSVYLGKEKGFSKALRAKEVLWLVFSMATALVIAVFLLVALLG